MTDACGAVPPADDALRLLALLARTGAFARVRGRGAEIWVRDRSLGVADGAVWHEIVANGWVESLDGGTRKISLSGRRHLRRDRSRAGAPLQTASAAEPRQLSVASDPLPQINVAESPLAWLARRRDRYGSPMISGVQFEAGERLRADLWFAEMTPRVTANWSAIGQGAGGRSRSAASGPELRDGLLAARERVRLALSAVGPELSGILIDVCAHLKGLEAVEQQLHWPQRSAKLVLQLALDSLARHYGMHRSRSRVARHWGADDFRPSIEEALSSQERG